MANHKTEITTIQLINDEINRLLRQGLIKRKTSPYGLHERIEKSSREPKQY